MVVGLFIFESVSVSWSCRAGCTSAVGCRLKGSFHSWGEMREQAATRAASTAFDPAHNHTTPHLQTHSNLCICICISNPPMSNTDLWETTKYPKYPNPNIDKNTFENNRFSPEGKLWMGLHLELTPSPFSVVAKFPINLTEVLPWSPALLLPHLFNSRAAVGGSSD